MIFRCPNCNREHVGGTEMLRTVVVCNDCCSRFWIAESGETRKRTLGEVSDVARPTAPYSEQSPESGAFQSQSPCELSSPASASHITFKAEVKSKFIGYYWLWMFWTFLVPYSARCLVKITSDGIEFSFNQRQRESTQQTVKDVRSVYELFLVNLLLIFIGPVLAATYLFLLPIRILVGLLLTLWTTLMIQYRTTTILIPTPDIIDARLVGSKLFVSVAVYKNSNERLNDMLLGRPVSRLRRFRIRRHSKESYRDFSARLETIREVLKENKFDRSPPLRSILNRDVRDFS